MGTFERIGARHVCLTFSSFSLPTVLVSQQMSVYSLEASAHTQHLGPQSAQAT